jgi:hypothetical protein
MLTANKQTNLNDASSNELSKRSPWWLRPLDNENV